MERNHNENQ